MVECGVAPTEHNHQANQNLQLHIVCFEGQCWWLGGGGGWRGKEARVGHCFKCSITVLFLNNIFDLRLAEAVDLGPMNTGGHLIWESIASCPDPSRVICFRYACAFIPELGAVREMHIQVSPCAVALNGMNI